MSTDENNQNNPSKLTEEMATLEIKENSDQYTYATLMETNGEECESWYYFIRYQGNEENLRHLYDQIESIDWYVLDDLSTFDMEINYLVSERTAKEMTKIDMNHTSFHRKFDGKLEKITFPFKKKDSNEKKMKRVYEILSYGQIEDYVDEEDIDEEDLLNQDSRTESSDTDESDSEESEPEADKTPNPKKIPPALSANKLPRFAKAKRKNRKRH